MGIQFKNHFLNGHSTENSVPGIAFLEGLTALDVCLEGGLHWGLENHYCSLVPICPLSVPTPSDSTRQSCSCQTRRNLDRKLVLVSEG